QLPRLLDRGADAAAPGVDEDAGGHRPHPADLVAEPAEQHAAGRRPDQESRRDDPEPLAGYLLARRGAEQLPEGRAGDEWEQAHLQAVEHPPEQGGGERQLTAAARDGGEWGHGGFRRITVAFGEVGVI